MDQLTMYMVTHKPVRRVPAGRTPIYVGSGPKPDGCLTDSTGCQIAAKNPYYCELTALYWIWKNDTSSQYVSIEHYRRFFLRALPVRLASRSYLLGLLQKGAVVTTRQAKWRTPLREIYAAEHILSDLEAVERAMERQCPDYLADYRAVMSGTSMAVCNMAAMSKQMFDAYCAWLFGLLFAIEPELSLEGRPAYQQRVYGFLAERLLNVWVRHNAPSIRRLPFWFRGDHPADSLLQTLRLYLNTWK